MHPMRADLIDVGYEEMRTAEEVDAVLGNCEGTVLVMINSVCIAAGNARPAAKAAAQHNKLPNKLTTVFVGQKKAVAKVREYAFYPHHLHLLFYLKMVK